MDVPGILFPSTTPKHLIRGVLVAHLPRLRRTVASQEGASERTVTEASVDLGAYMDSIQSQCGHTCPAPFRRRSL